MNNEIKKLKIEVSVWDIEIVEERKNQGYYVFKYSVKINNGKKITGEDDGSWSGQTKKHFEKVMNNGYACRLALEAHF